tara:strand:+ start:154 stop:1053 length:900 start_codon:yes stop_codon:yes gene_type:complete
MASHNFNVGTTSNSNDGDTLRESFIKVKKMFAEVYGQTYSEQGDLSGTEFKIKESKLQMTTNAVAGDDGKVLTYNHATNGFTWETKFDGDISTIVAGYGLVNNGSTLNLTLNELTAATVDVANDSIAIIDSNDSNASRKEAISDLISAIAGTGLTASSGVLNADAVTISNNSIGADELNVSGNGSLGSVLTSDGDGTFSWTISTLSYTPSFVTSAIQTWSNGYLYVLVNTSPLTLTLPASPITGTSFKFANRSGQLNTLARNGNLIMGISEDLALDNLTASFELAFAGGVQGWVIIGAN